MLVNLFEDIIKNTPRSKRKRLTGDKLSSMPVIGMESPIESKTSNLKLSSQAKLWHLLILLIVVIATTLVFFSKTYALQVIKGSENLALSDENSIRIFTVQAERGVIYDRTGKILVRNRPAFGIELNTNICGDNCNYEIDQLKKFINIDQSKIAEELSSEKEIVILATGLSKEEILPVEANLVLMPSISVSTVPQRDYVYKNAFSHVLGYVGLGDTLKPTIVGKDGVELTYNNHLSGFPGSKIVQVNSLGQNIETISEKRPFPGKDVTLNLDASLQLKAAELLKQVVDDTETEAGVVVAQDPHTGGVLAIVSYPDFDPDKLSEGVTSEEFAEIQAGSNSPFFNRAISAAYPPGSTFKMGVLAAALSEEVVDEHTLIFDPGYIQIGPFIYRNWKLDGHGDVNAREAIALSNDVYFYTIGGGHGNISGLGISRLHDWMTKFGYGSKTGIDLEGEIAGFMPDGTHREWYLGDTFISSIGQGDVLATPLQVNNATVYFANGGYLLKPSIVKNVDGVGEASREIISESIVSKDVHQVVKEGMKMVTESGGTAYPFFDFADKHSGIVPAGKTGTSEYISPGGKERTHAWFTVFAPYENPEIALTVFLEGGGGGSDDAAPIARELMDLWFNNSN